MREHFRPTGNPVADPDCAFARPEFDVVESDDRLTINTARLLLAGSDPNERGVG